MYEFYRAERVTVVQMPHDSGLSASRNALVQAIDADYLALCDDDFVLGPATAFTTAIEILESEKDLGVLGGRLHDFDGRTERVRNWEMFFDLDRQNGRFTATPIYNYPPITRRVSGETVFMCDAVMNFAVFRKAMFRDAVQWDEEIKINGEHEDFYLNLKTNSPFRVAYWPSMAALHLQTRQDAVYSNLRERSEGRRRFLEKWGLSSHLEIGTGGRPLDGGSVLEWFAGSRRDKNSDSAVEVISGTPPANGWAGIAHMHLYARETTDDVARESVRQCESLVEWLEESRGSSVSLWQGSMLFAYRPEVDSDGRMCFWYRTSSIAEPETEARASAEVFFRWFSSRGDVLVWESERYQMRYPETRYWQPLDVALPLWPKGSEHLRFEVVAASSERSPLGTGFVFQKGSSERAVDRGAFPTVLALCRTTVDAARVKVPHERLADTLNKAPRVQWEFIRTAGDEPWVTIDVSGFSMFGVSGDAGLVVAAGLAGQTSENMPIALPLSLVGDPGNVFWAIGGEVADGELFVVVPEALDS
jgi:hypothetical protein